VINSNLPPISHRFRDVAFDKSKIAIFGYPASRLIPPNARWRRFLHHIIVSYISLKVDALGYISVAGSLAIVNHIYAVRPDFQNRYIWLPLLCLSPPDGGVSLGRSP